MVAQQQTAQPARPWTLNRTLLIVATALFVLAALAAGLNWSISMWCFGWGAFAAWALAGAV